MEIVEHRDKLIEFLEESRATADMFTGGSVEIQLDDDRTLKAQFFDGADSELW